jgi:hypothetical protein
MLKNFKSAMFVRQMSARQMFGLDAGDWSIFFAGLALAGFLVVLI